MSIYSSRRRRHGCRSRSRARKIPRKLRERRRRCAIPPRSISMASLRSRSHADSAAQVCPLGSRSAARVSAKCRCSRSRTHTSRRRNGTSGGRRSRERAARRRYTALQSNKYNHRGALMIVKKRLVAAAAPTAVVSFGAAAQSSNPPPATPRIYIFDNGAIRGLDPALFNFTRDELAEVDFVNISYLIVHPRGALMFDAGAVPDSEFPADGSPVTEGIMSATQPLKPQLAAAGFTPSDVTHFALSHYHSDHTANANEFAAATWIVQKAERDFMFAESPQGIIAPDTFDKLRDAEAVILDNEDYDVFGDGR